MPSDKCDRSQQQRGRHCLYSEGLRGARNVGVSVNKNKAKACVGGCVVVRYGWRGKARPGISHDIMDGTVYVQVSTGAVSTVVPAIVPVRPKRGATQQRTVHALCATFGGVVGMVRKSEVFTRGTKDVRVRPAVALVK